ncbi:UNVERIFIED_CONTAM: hypothetical protein GTU68_060294 [Idotea baltica]|nr:hypothetical protein [Idotea baltica]
MYVTSPSPENLNTLFEFLLKGLDAMGYEKHIHYQTLVSSNSEHNKAILRVTIKKEHRQIVQYISPSESDVLANAELVVIDEAAAIPLPQVQALLGPYLVFMASTISGYEGTGRSLSLKLIKELRDQSKKREGGAATSKKKKRILNYVYSQLSLRESIRYKEGDHVEKWLNDLLCLEASAPTLKKDLPAPEDCDIYYVNRDTLFGYHKMSEKFLKSMMSLLVSSHYRNTPDDLQTLSDAPAHHLFVLLSPSQQSDAMPLILCVVQVALEGKISKVSLSSSSHSGKKPSGDLIPWTVSNLFQDTDFPQLSGARIVRIATHPDLQGRGYGSRAIELVHAYYDRSSWKASTEDDAVVPKDEPCVNNVQEEEVGLLDEAVLPRDAPSPLLLSTKEREAEALHYLGVSFGASFTLFKFWKKAGFSCLYLSQVKNQLTGEHTCLLLKVLNEDKAGRKESWLRPLCFDFQKRMLNLLPGCFRHLESEFALSLLTNKIYKKKAQAPLWSHLKMHLTQFDLKMLDAFTRHQCDLSHISSILPSIASLYFRGCIPNSKFKALQSVSISF